MTPGASRGIRIPDLEKGIPIVGQVAAGHPILAQEHIEKYLQFAGELFTPKADFMLRVRGMSMKDIGILDGDLLAVHKTKTASNGQIVVARLDDEVTVKRFEKIKNTVLLHPENDAFDTIEIDLTKDPFAIEGLSVGVIRH